MSTDAPKKSRKSMFRALFSRDAGRVLTASLPKPPPKPSTRRDDILQAFSTLALTDERPITPGFVGGFDPGCIATHAQSDTRPHPHPDASSAPRHPGFSPFPSPARHHTGPAPLPRPPPMPAPQRHAALPLAPQTYPHASLDVPPVRPHSESVLPPPAFVLSPSPGCTPGLAAPPPAFSISAHTGPKPARTQRARSASTPPPASTASTASARQDGSKARCSGVTKAGRPCTRVVKAGPPLSSVDPDVGIVRFCFQHSREVMAPTGFHVKNAGRDKWVTFSEWIPAYLHTETQAALRAEMEKEVSVADVDGYIYTFEIRDPSSPSTIKLKVGRTVHLIKRIDQWGKQCGTKEQVLRGWWPGTIGDEEPSNGSLMKGRVQQGKKGRFCHKLERLVHLELADLVMGGVYLDPMFPSPSVKRPEPRTNKPGVKKSAGCVDCGTMHKEIFEFQRVENGLYKGKEWDCIVKPVIEKWGKFVENHYLL